MSNLIARETIESRIFEIRGRKVMLDRDLATLYAVKTKVLNQAVKRNIKRFPKDFMFQLTKSEKDKVVTICDHLKKLKYSPQLPYAFTEQGVAMLSSVINSEQAIQVNILIMRAFTKLREMMIVHKDLKRKIETMERKFESRFKKHEHHFKLFFEAIKQLLEPSEEPKGRLGFHQK